MYFTRENYVWNEGTISCSSVWRKDEQATAVELRNRELLKWQIVLEYLAFNRHSPTLHYPAINSVNLPRSAFNLMIKQASR